MVSSGPQGAGSRRRVVVLGSTGSIGTSCLDVIDNLPDRLEAWGLCAHKSWETFLGQLQRWQPACALITDAEAARQLSRQTLPKATRLLEGPDGIAAMVSDPQVDIV